MSRRIAYCRRASRFARAASHFLSALAICLGLGADNLIGHAATVTGSIQDVTSQPYGGMVNQIQFTPLSCPQAIGTNTVWPVARAARLTNGLFSVNLVGGLYYVGIVDGQMAATARTIKILVPPNETNVWQLNTCANLATNLGTFTWTNTPQGFAVTTSNSPSVTFTGNGTSTNPLSATAAGAASAVTNWIQTNGASYYSSSTHTLFYSTNDPVTPSQVLNIVTNSGTVPLIVGPLTTLQLYAPIDVYDGSGYDPTLVLFDNATKRMFPVSRADGVSLNLGDINLTTTGANTVGSLNSQGDIRTQGGNLFGNDLSLGGSIYIDGTFNGNASGAYNIPYSAISDPPAIPTTNGFVTQAEITAATNALGRTSPANMTNAANAFTGTFTGTMSGNGSGVTNVLYSSISGGVVLNTNTALTTITFPSSTANWTNTTGKAITLYIDNTGVTGTTTRVNGTQIFSSLLLDATIVLPPGSYFSQTYTVGTPSAKYQ